MSKRNSQRERQPTRQCLFCESDAVSWEHLWPAWMAPYFPKTSHDKSQETWRRIGPTAAVIVGQKIFHRHATNRKLRYVCHRCNNGWMSQIEQSAKPFLEPMMRGVRTNLNADAQRAVSEWVTLKMMLYEQTDIGATAYGEDATVFTRADTLAFSVSRTMPNHLNLWLLKSGGTLFESHITRAFTQLIRSDDRVNAEPIKANTHTVLFGAGRFLAYFVHSSRGDHDAFKKLRMTFAQAVWPVSKTLISWPPISTVTDSQAEYLAWTLERYVMSLKRHVS